MTFTSLRSYRRFTVLLARTLTRPAAITMTLLAMGCAERPSLQIDRALEALQAARLAGAEEYAVEHLMQAEISYQKAIDELVNQEEHPFPLRSYSQAIAFLSAALSQAEQARAEAFLNREETRINAQIALSMAKHHMFQAHKVLDKALPSSVNPTLLAEGKLTLQRGERLLEATETEIKQGEYIQAMTTAHTVETLALDVHRQFFVVEPPVSIERV